MTTLLLVAILSGCGNVKSAPPPAAYGKEGPSIAQARERRQDDRQELAREEAEAQQRRIAAATQQAVADAQKSAAPAPAANGQIKHIVVMWLKKPGDADARKTVLEAGQTMKKIPGVIDVVGGEVIPSERAVVDSSYDIAFVMTFADTEALKNYGPHPIHQKLVEEVVKPNVERYLVYDLSVR